MSQLEMFSPPKEPTGQQHRDILMHLRLGNKLTGLEALKLFGTMKLATRCSELHQMGWDIKSETIETETGKHISRYFI
jgi:hypothetical protein